jgi:hypothetical protein
LAGARILHETAPSRLSICYATLSDKVSYTILKVAEIHKC